eukprot:356177-Chlamydomonas_euryale.AAC.12
MSQDIQIHGVRLQQGKRDSRPLVPGMRRSFNCEYSVQLTSLSHPSEPAELDDDATLTWRRFRVELTPELYGINAFIFDSLREAVSALGAAALPAMRLTSASVPRCAASRGLPKRIGNIVLAADR